RTRCGRTCGVGRRRARHSGGARCGGRRRRPCPPIARSRRGPVARHGAGRPARASRGDGSGAQERRGRAGAGGEGLMKPILVSGGTGFVGANVVRELVALGASVRVLARRGGDRRALEGVTVEIVEGDLLDPASLARAVRGADTLYHVAADYRLWARDPMELHRVNVDGTRAMLDVAGEAGVRRIVY